MDQSDLELQQAVEMIGAAIPAATSNEIKQALEEVMKPIKDDLADVKGKLAGLSSKIDALFADYTARHNANCFYENSRARSRQDPVKWPFQKDGTLPKLRGEPPRALPENVQQLDDIVEADLDTLNGGYKVALIAVPGTDLDRKLASLKYFLTIRI
jgi:hypothetical protein